MKRILPIIFLTIFSINNCQASENVQVTKRKDTIIVAMHMDDVITLDPHHAYERTNVMIHHNTYDTLVEFKPSNFNIASPRLAVKWDITKNGLIYIFYLRPSIKFASGNTFTAEDVCFSWNRLINLKGNPSFYSNIIRNIKMIDDLTVTVELKHPSPAFLSIVAAPAMCILDSKIVKLNGGKSTFDASQTDTAKAWLDQNSAGSGPFVLVKWKPKSEIVLQKNQNYWGKTHIKKVIIRHVVDSSTQLQLAQKGDADIIHTLDIDLVNMVLKSPKLELITGQTLNIVYIAMSPDPVLGGILSNKNVRQAISYAIDYQGIQNLVGGYAAFPPSIIPLGITGVKKTEIHNKYDVKMAKSLLKKIHSLTNFFELDLFYGAEPGTLRETIAAKIKNDLIKIGIKVNLHPMQLSLYLSAMRSQKLPFALGIWTPDYVDPTMWTDYFSYQDKGVAYRIKYNNNEVSKLANKISKEIDYTRRSSLIEKIQNIWLDDMSFFTVYQPKQLVALPSNLKGFVYDPILFTNFSKLYKLEADK